MDLVFLACEIHTVWNEVDLVYLACEDTHVMERSGLSIFGLRRYTRNGTKWTKYIWLAKIQKPLEQTRLSLFGLRRYTHVWNEVDLVYLAYEDTHGMERSGLSIFGLRDTHVMERNRLSIFGLIME